jgi:hypothetical protein
LAIISKRMSRVPCGLRIPEQVLHEVAHGPLWRIWCITQALPSIGVDAKQIIRIYELTLQIGVPPRRTCHSLTRLIPGPKSVKTSVISDPSDYGLGSCCRRVPRTRIHAMDAPWKHDAR